MEILILFKRHAIIRGVDRREAVDAPRGHYFIISGRGESILEMRLLVTGAAGFIGHHLCRLLLSRGYEVWGLDNLSRGDPARIGALERMGMRFIKADIRNPEDVRSAIREAKPEAIAHLAALISVSESLEKPDLYRAVNAVGTRNLVSAANSFDVHRIVYASSAAVYGNPAYLPIDEEHPTNPLSPYGETKLEGERCVLEEFRGDGRGIALRLFNVYGLGQNPEYAGVITRFMERLSAGEPPVIFGDGEQTRDFVYVADVAEAFLRALTCDSAEPQVFNIGSGKSVKVIDLARLMISLFELDLEPVHTDPRPGDIRHSCADISRARKVLGWRPRTSLESGLRELLSELRG